jgi:glycosyltransferase involved in cell wall biosynthesis
VIPIVVAGFFRRKLFLKSVLIYHGSLDDLRPFNYYYLKRKIYEFSERFYILNGGKVVCVSHVMKEGLCRKYPHQIENFAVSPNVPSMAFIDEIEKYKNFDKVVLKKELGLTVNKKLICYSGNVQEWQKISLFISLIKQTKGDVHFLILTQQLSEFNQLLIGVDVDKYTILTVQNEQVPQYLCAADFLYLVRDDNETNQYSCPTKAVEYLYSSRPIICSHGLGDISGIIKENGNGFLIDIKEEGVEDRIMDEINNFKFETKVRYCKVPSFLLHKSQLVTFRELVLSLQI